jgi:hypothetical protein
MKDQWNRGNILPLFKKEVCTITGDPFYNIYINGHRTTEEIRMGCLIGMENLVFTGKNEEARRMGCMYILMSMVQVSERVREAMPWLL